MRRRVSVKNVLAAFQVLNARPVQRAFRTSWGICGMEALHRAFGVRLVPTPLKLGFIDGWDGNWAATVFMIGASAVMSVIVAFLFNDIAVPVDTLLVIGIIRFLHGVYIGHRAYAAVTAWRIAKDAEQLEQARCIFRAAA